MEYISPRSRRDLEFHERHGEISTISATSRQSRRVLGNLGEMEHISPRSRRDLESNKNHGEISARSLQSRRDLINLDEISPISARSRQSRRDLGKNFARVAPVKHCILLMISQTPDISNHFSFPLMVHEIGIPLHFQTVTNQA